MSVLTEEFKQHQRAVLQRRIKRYLAMQDPHFQGEIPERKEFKQKFIPILQKALGHLETENYGICVDCGEEIPLIRLQTVPAAFRCTKCQTLFEEAHDVRRT